MPSKKILHIAPVLRGGVRTVIQNIVSDTLHEYDCMVVVIGEYIPFEANIDKQIRFIGLPTKKRFDFKQIFKLFKLIKANDIIHVHLFPSLYYCAFFKLFFPKKNFIFTEHASTNNRRKHKLFKLIEIPIYSVYNHVVAVSESCKKALDEWLSYKVKTQTIYNGIDVKQLQAQPKLDFHEFGITAKYIITMVARLSTDKDFLTLLKAMTLLNDDYHLVLVGDGELYQQIIDETHQLSLEKKVTLLGNRADVASILSASTLSVLSSHAEGMGLTIIESLAVRTPCIGSDVEGIKDLLPNTYRFPKGNETALAKLIQQVVRKEIPPLPYDCITNKYSIKTMMDAYRKLYEHK